MRTCTLIRCALIWGVSLWVLPSYAEQIVFQSTDTPPYWSAELPDNGVGGAILKLVSEAAGISYTIDYLPVARYRRSDAPYIVGDPDILINQKRRAIFPIGVFRSAFFYYKPNHDAIEYRSLHDLKGHSMGVLRGTLEDKSRFAKNGIRVEESDSVESLLRKLKRGRIDFCITVADTGRYTLEQLFPDERDHFVQQMIPGLNRPIAIMIDLETRDGEIMAKRYRNVLEKTLRSQKYRDILEHFYGKSMIMEYNTDDLNRFVQFYAGTWSQ
ncbi:substrate-binding periplasmic protein [Gallionella capsiferriformans]|uniref:Extracellular solute-binding protein family 3 n=1 Tax=Gallionella capsiferriformans (strain ES-2) TaxID=395494 RepID=D9SFN6_GALCS|nr:ABC transporter substrate-binding protein [Gallionella capsiferriformans]ADL55333.1 extracellular solute-binding protein family 3 [Gallionella capsiferriformans ES-2]